eukprot:5633242-Alexandrium_andersonii.AAC.1
MEDPRAWSVTPNPPPGRSSTRLNASSDQRPPGTGPAPSGVSAFSAPTTRRRRRQKSAKAGQPSRSLCPPRLATQAARP